MFRLHFRRQELRKVYISRKIMQGSVFSIFYRVYLLDRKIDDCGILLDEERVFGESLDIQDQVWGKPSDLKSFHKILFVRFILLFRLTVEFR